MNQLKEFLDKNISLCNKTNVLEIILGKVSSPNIFITNIYSEVNIKSLFKNLKSPDFKFKVTINSSYLKRFYYENNIIDAFVKNEDQTTINHYSKSIEHIKTIEDQRFDIQLQISQYSSHTLIINSPIFNHSEEIEEFEISINSSFSIIIEKTTGFLCKIQIFKPIDTNLIIEILKLFPISSYS